MTEIEKKALALVNEVECVGWLPHEVDRIPNFRTICRAIEQHETFRQEVSEAITDLTYIQHQYTFARGEVLGHLEKFVLKEPVDPLVEVLDECGFGVSSNAADDIRAALAARGLKIVEDK